MIINSTQIHVMSGIPSSGKTTFSQQLANELDAILYCYDALPKKSWNDDIHQSMYNNIIRDLQHTKIVVCDDLHMTKEQRGILLKALNDIKCIKILHVMLTPLDICLERNNKRNSNIGKLSDTALRYCYTKYEFPTIDEGWDEIIYHEYVKE